MTQHTTDGFAFDGRIAEVLGGTRFAGYLHVTVPEMVTSRITYVDMVFARPDPGEPDHWRYEDRADPGTASAQEELAAARLDWYGEQFGLRWLDGDAAARVLREVFHDGAERA
ncbi:hypothetical protein ABJI51_35235 [Amycolatopsis sp. NEAU-NG30]|uniref:Uncharacterized protein n=1 Tax=Amycolatopsis melonis TaxID=3156488 RepID=A0ABV0LPX2_9PSEU